MASLSYFKKRTAYLNNTYGTSLSPTRLWGIYQRTGQLPANIPDILSAPDPRTEAGRAGYTALSEESVKMTFARLGEANRYVERIRWGTGGYISQGGNITYQLVNGQWYKMGARDSQPVKSENPPRNARKLTATEAKNLIAEKAKEIKAKTKDHPSRGYLSM